MKYKIEDGKIVITEDYKYIQDHMQKTNVIVIWNETDKEITSEYLQQNNSVAIVINSLPVDYCIIKIIHKAGYSYQEYGSLIVNDIHISKLVLKYAIVADMKWKVD
jgi:hypothetical protein